MTHPPRCARLAAILLGTALFLGSGPALAEPSADDRALARTLFEDGRALLKAGNYKDAVPKLEESQRLDPGMGTLFNLADCYEKVGRFASAWAAFAEVADLAKRLGQTDRETIARERVQVLAPKVPKLKLHMNPPLPPGLELKWDEKPLSIQLLDTDMPVDGGEHKLRASAPGKVASESKVTIPGVGTTSFEIPALADAPPEPPSGGPAVDPVGKPPEQGSDTNGWQKPTSYVVGGLGIIGLGVGSVFGLTASSQWSDAESACPQNRCSADGYGKWEDARSSATISTIAFTAGIVLVASAAVLFFTAPSGSSSSAKRTTSHPSFARAR